MRRVQAAAALGVVAFLGLGTSYVFADAKGTPQTGAIPICHSGNGKNFTPESPDASAVLKGHDGHDFDIIPPFSTANQDGTTTNYPGKNMDATYGTGATGAEVLANGCQVPTGPPTDTTATINLQTPELLPGTVKVPGGFATLPATTTDTVVPTTVTVPPQTVTGPGATTLVTVPVGQTTTVTTPANTVTLPAQTVTVGGAVVTQPAETVTVPGETQTVTAAGTTTVVTVTAPNTRFVRGGVLAARIKLAVAQHRRVVRLRGRVLHFALRHLKRQKVIVIVVRRGCPAGTKLSPGGRCAPIVRGRG